MLLHNSNSLTSIDHLTKDFCFNLFSRAKEFKQVAEGTRNGPVRSPIKTNPLSIKTVALAFFENSTRTKMSFELAAKNLKLNTLFFGPEHSSISKGETFYDTLKMLEAYADIIVLRHPEIGSADFAAKSVNCPIINAGDGAGEHPTQTLLDLFSLWCFSSNFQDCSLGIIGDIAQARTIQSLLKVNALFPFKKLYLLPINEAGKESAKSILDSLSVPYEFADNCEDVLSHSNFVYMTRIQKERYESEDLLAASKEFRINRALVEKCLNPEELKILHPLPRNQELAEDVDTMPCAAYFEQARNGVYIRQALIEYMLELNFSFNNKTIT